MSKILWVHLAGSLWGNLSHQFYYPVSLQLLNLPTCIASFGSLGHCWHRFKTCHHRVTLLFIPTFFFFFCHALISTFIWFRGSEPHILPSHSCLPNLSERLGLWTWTLLLPSPTFSFMGWLIPFPLTCFFSSIGSCYLSCLGDLCDFPVPAWHRHHLPSFLSHADESPHFNLLVTNPS